MPGLGGGRWRRWRRCGGGRGRTPWPHVLRHRGPHASRHARAHHGARARGRVRHTLSRIELHVFIQIARNPDRGALVQHLFHLFGQADVFNVKLGDRQPVFRNLRPNRLCDDTAQIGGVCRHVENWDARLCQNLRDLLQDHIADLKADFIGGKLTIGADDFGEKTAWIGNPHRIGAKGAQAHGPKFRVARHDRVLGAPFVVIEPGGVDEIQLGLEGAVKAMVPVLQCGHYRHVVGFQHVKAGTKDIGQLAFMHEHRRLAFAHRQLGAVFDRLAPAFKAPDHRVARVIQPLDDINEFAFEEIENHGGSLSRSCGRDAPISTTITVVAAV